MEVTVLGVLLLATLSTPGLAKDKAPVQLSDPPTGTIDWVATWDGRMKKGRAFGPGRLVIQTELREGYGQAMNKPPGPLRIEFEGVASLDSTVVVGRGEVVEGGFGLWCEGDIIEGELNWWLEEFDGRVTMADCGKRPLRWTWYLDWWEGRAEFDGDQERLDAVGFADGGVLRAEGLWDGFDGGTPVVVEYPDGRRWETVTPSHERLPAEMLAGTGRLFHPDGRIEVGRRDADQDWLWTCAEGDCWNGEGRGVWVPGTYTGEPAHGDKGEWRGGFVDGLLDGAGTWTDGAGRVAQQTWERGETRLPFERWTDKGHFRRDLRVDGERRIEITLADGQFAVFRVDGDGVVQLQQLDPPAPSFVPDELFGAVVYSQTRWRTCFSGDCAGGGRAVLRGWNSWVLRDGADSVAMLDDGGVWRGPLDDKLRPHGDGELCQGESCAPAVMQRARWIEGATSLAAFEAAEAAEQAAAQARAEAREKAWQARRQAAEDRRTREKAGRAAAWHIQQSALRLVEFIGAPERAMESNREALSAWRMGTIAAEDLEREAALRYQSMARMAERRAFDELVGSRDDLAKAFEHAAAARSAMEDAGCRVPRMRAYEAELDRLRPVYAVLRQMYRTQRDDPQGLIAVTRGLDGDRMASAGSAALAEAVAAARTADCP